MKRLFQLWLELKAGPGEQQTAGIQGKTRIRRWMCTQDAVILAVVPRSKLPPGLAQGHISGIHILTQPEPAGALKGLPSIRHQCGLLNSNTEATLLLENNHLNLSWLLNRGNGVLAHFVEQIIGYLGLLLLPLLSSFLGVRNDSGLVSKHLVSTCCVPSTDIKTRNW